MTTPPFHHPLPLLDAVDRTHRKVGVAPGDDPSLRYVIPVPRSWGRVSAIAASPDANRAEILGVFSPSADLRGPRIIVSATRLRYEVHAEQWVHHAWAAAGWSIATARPLEPRFHPRFEIGALRKLDGAVEMRRCTGFVDNGRLFRVDVAAPSRR